jgi:hypothetical protein
MTGKGAAEPRTGGKPGAALCVLYPCVAASAYAVAEAPKGSRGTAYIALHIGLSVLMIALWRLAPGASRSIFAAGVAARAVLLFAPPFTTHDVARYLWDGRVALAGLDPYTLTADSPATAAFRPVWAVAQEHARYATLYPPLAIAVFAACAACGPVLALWAWKGVVTSASIATLWFARRLLEQRGASQHLAVVALSPLLLLEAGVGAHLDALPTLAVAAALWLVEKKHGRAAGAVLVKFLPLVVLLPLAWTAGWRRAVSMCASAACALGLGYLGAFSLGWKPFGSLSVFFAKWRFGSPGFALIESVAGAERALPLAALIGAAALLLAATAFACRPAAALAAPMIASPIVFPWYLSPLVPAMAAAPSFALLFWTLSAPLTYEVIDAFDAGGIWAPQAWPLVAMAAAVMGGAVADMLTSARRASGA